MVCLYSAYFQEGIEEKVAFDEKEEERRIFLIRMFCVHSAIEMIEFCVIRVKCNFPFDNSP